ncbi:low molecular weight phosphotyrosine protein phosphatase [Kocuria sp. cx-455]|uniref:low molecular weight protein-tyrosine-phosphatase n=1 Tax=unclassified Candidatus Sulfotelmatobacter TaxID=2635724 RepID=UPI00168654E5|nr:MULTISPECIES: low molecular weight protein-tyrosine-phosphatase [unclassified Candidatus Sulfotelmatobacter]MBD2761639.1 low molecular weight phosphotyrosine protein phosphatase [Kocuria sp. cx-116]MBD2764088.1 low molecular weight phosphotyrosine protein phosphatase [Kocuria sp. cx-455]
MFKIVTVCTGNICRSPMAQALLIAELSAAGLQDRVSVFSAGISDEEHGNPVDSRAVTVLARNDLELPDHQAHRITDDELRDADLVLAMTAAHQAELRRRLGDEQAEQVRLMRSFGTGNRNDNDLDIADPWYGGADDFDLAWEQIHAAAPHVVSEVSQRLTRP